MNTTTLQDRKNAYRLSNDIIKEVYVSGELTNLLKRLLKTKDISMPTWDIVGDAILGIYTTQEIPERLQQGLDISADDAQRIYADLQYFLKLVTENEGEEKSKRNKDLKELQQTFTPASTDTPVESTTDQSNEGGKKTPPFEKVPTTPEEPPVHTPVQGMRTMETDMNRIHGYGAYRAQFPEEAKEAKHTEEVIRSASQEDILQEKLKLTDMPTYEENEGNTQKLKEEDTNV